MDSRFEFLEEAPLVDEPVRFRVSGLRPAQVVAVEATWSLDGVAVRSTGIFHADRRGVVAPAKMASTGGTYLGRDPFGLWWSARPVIDPGGQPGPAVGAQPPAPGPPAPGTAPITTHLVARSGGEDLCLARLERRWHGPGVEVVTLAEHGLVGRLFRPPVETFPAVIVLGGSRGGLAGSETKAALLASHGIGALAVAYFGLPGRPTALADIALEYVLACIRWLLDQPGVAGEQVGVVGNSRGAELALLLATTSPEIGCVVAGSPSSVIWPGVGPGIPDGAPAWSWHGHPVPSIGRLDPHMLAEALAGAPVTLAPVLEAALADIPSTARAAIPVERSHAPILLVSGQDDALWPSTAMADAIEWRARRKGGGPVCHRRYANAGHLCPTHPGLPIPAELIHPLDNRRYLFGGSARGNAAAAADSWAHSVAFLSRSLLSPARATTI